MDYPQIVARLRALREARPGLHQATVAERLGVSTSMVSHYERLRRRADLETLVEWAGALGHELQVELVEGRPGAAARAAEQARALSSADARMVLLLVEALQGGHLTDRERQRLELLVASHTPGWERTGRR